MVLVYLKLRHVYPHFLGNVMKCRKLYMNGVGLLWGNEIKNKGAGTGSGEMEGYGYRDMGIKT